MLWGPNKLHDVTRCNISHKAVIETVRQCHDTHDTFSRDETKLTPSHCYLTPQSVFLWLLLFLIKIISLSLLPFLIPYLATFRPSHYSAKINSLSFLVSHLSMIFIDFFSWRNVYIHFPLFTSVFLFPSLSQQLTLTVILDWWFLSFELICPILFFYVGIYKKRETVSLKLFTYAIK